MVDIASFGYAFSSEDGKVVTCNRLELFCNVEGDGREFVGGWLDVDSSCWRDGKNTFAGSDGYGLGDDRISA